MSHPEPRSVLHIAIALAALKHKPWDQSTQSYLLDLQSRFPIATKDNHNGDWRTYALELEKQITTLKAQYDADQEHSTADAPPPKKKTKKNPTKDQHDPEWSWDQRRADWSRLLSSQYPSSPSLVTACASLKGVLASPDPDHLLHASRLTDALLRALDTMHLFLFSPPKPGPTPSALGPQYLDSARIAVTSPLLMYLLRTAMPALLRTTKGDTKSKRQRHRIRPTHAQVDIVLGHLLERVLLPLLRAIAPLCYARLEPLVTPLPKKPGRPVIKTKTKDKTKDKDKRADPTTTHPTDARTDAFALIGTSLEALDALTGFRTSAATASIASGIRDRLGLETIRELEALYAPRPSEGLQPAAPSQPPSQPTPTAMPLPAPQPEQRAQQRGVTESRANRLEKVVGTRAERVRALATRDAGWFLASTLNLCVTPAAEGERSGGLLREALLDRIGRLVRSAGLLDNAVHARAVDPVCRNMLLAICERSMAQLAPCADSQPT